MILGIPTKWFMVLLTSLVLVVAGVVVFVLHPWRADSSPTRQELASAHQALQADFAGASSRVSPSIIRKVTKSADGSVSGTLAILSPEGPCLGFTITVDRDYVLYGNQKAVHLGKIQTAPSSWCRL